MSNYSSMDMSGNGHYHNQEYNYNNQEQQMQMATVLCCSCGVPIDGSTGLVMCYDCIKMNVDITEGIPRESNLSFCRNCERFLQPPTNWIKAELESRELLALCLRRLKGLNKIRLIDASFIWTEPHSRRIRVKLTVQGEAFQNAIIQQTFEVEYVVIAMQCADCAKSYTAHTWNTQVQIRQKVPHKRTFLFLEQMILKHNAHVDTISIQESKDGLDFFYAKQNHAVRMLDFLNAVVPIKSKKSSELITADIHSGTSVYKFSYSVEIAPVCKDDLVVLPAKLAKSMGNISRLVLCSKVSNMLQFIDPQTLQIADVQANIYWRYSFPSLADVTQLVEFMVLDVEPVGDRRGKYLLADVTCVKSNEMGSGEEFYVRSHLGGILHPGDTAMGYFLKNSNFNSALFDELDTNNVCEVMLVKKHYIRSNKRARRRQWKLKRMANERSDIVARVEDEGAKNDRQARMERERAEKDYELFLQQLEEDNELREQVNLYKAEAPQYPVGYESETETDVEDEDAPTIDVDELLDELDEMTID